MSNQNNPYFKTYTERIKLKKPRLKHIIREPLEEGGVYKFIDGQLRIIEKQPVHEHVDLVLKPNVMYKSRDGRKVQVWAINKDYEKAPVIGMIQTEGIWEFRVWNEAGIARVPYGVGNDIVAEWSET